MTRLPDHLEKVPAPKPPSSSYLRVKTLLHTTTMICRQCIRRASALRPQFRIVRSISTTPTPTAPAPATASDAAPQFSNPLTGTTARPKPRVSNLPVSSAPAGTPLKGINYLKAADDPIALEEHEYPEWLWRCLDVKKDSDVLASNAGDEFCTPLLHFLSSPI